MPKHYAMGVNIQQGRIEFRGTKVMKIYYNLSFSQIPFVSISAVETESLPTYTLSVTKDFFIIKFSNPYTGALIWGASL
jgi:hypothetical protein